MNSKFCFEYNDGNAGNIELFATQAEAISEAEDAWHHLTHKERLEYTDRTRGGVFRVVFVENYDEEADDPLWEAAEIRDWADEMPRGTIPLVFENSGHVYYLDLPDIPGEDDVWKLIALYDEINGTDWWEILDESMILGLRLEEYWPRAIPVDHPEDMDEEDSA